MYMREIYALIHSDEDGNRIHFFKDGGELGEFLDDPEEFAGITSFVGEEKLAQEDDPRYWNRGEGMLVKIRILHPRERTKAWQVDDA